MRKPAGDTALPVMAPKLKETEFYKDLEKAEFSGREIPAAPEAKRKNRRMKIILFVLFIAFNAGVIIYTGVYEFGSKPPEKLGFAFGPWNYMMIGAGFLCAAFAIGTETAKYMLMMRATKVRVSFKDAFETAALGKYYDCITPSGVGGQPFQIYNLHKAGYSNGVSMAMPLTGFFTMQAGFVILAVFTFIFNGNAVTGLGIRIPAYIGVVMYMLAPVFIIVFTISEPAGEKLIRALAGLGAKIRLIKDPEKTAGSLVRTLNEHRESVLMMNRKKWLIPVLLGMSVLFQLAILSIPYFIIMAYNGSESFFNLLTMTAYAYCAVTIIPTPGNSGAAEGAFYIIFSQLDPTGLFWSMLIWRLACFYLFIGLGIAIYAAKAVKAGWKRSKGAAGTGRNMTGYQKSKETECGSITDRSAR